MGKKTSTFNAKLQAISKRITNKTLAAELNISTSTLYRYKTGKVKSPNPTTIKNINVIYGTVKNTHIPKSLSAKKELEKKKIGYTFEEKRHYSRIHTDHYIYSLNDISAANISDLAKHLNETKGLEIFGLKIVGIDDEGNRKRFSAPFAILYSGGEFQYENFEVFMDGINALMAKPSKQLKSIVHFEFIGKEYNG